MAADRAQHVAEVVRPALAEGRHVVTDRFAGSSIAYQGYARGLPVEEVRRLSDWATAGCWPDLVVVLTVPTAVADRRLDGHLDRMEAEGAAFHARVIDGFLRQAEADAEHWVVLDGDRSVDAVHAAVRSVVRERLQLPV
jgi:dTMP kinase